jgi:hypothetical protein
MYMFAMDIEFAFVSMIFLLEVGGFLRKLRFPPQIKLTSTIFTLKVALNTITLDLPFYIEHGILKI